LIHHHRKEGNLDEFVPIRVFVDWQDLHNWEKEEEEREENHERNNRNTHRNAFQEL